MDTQEDILLLDESLILGAEKKLRQVITCQQIELIFDEYQVLLDELDDTENLYRELRAELQKDEELNTHLLIVRVANGLIATAGYYQEEVAWEKKAAEDSQKRKKEIEELQLKPITPELKARIEWLQAKEEKEPKEVEIAWSQRSWARHNTESSSVIPASLEHLKKHNFPIWEQLQALDEVCKNSKRVNGVYKKEGEL